jgi:hypothetical protein
MLEEGEYDLPAEEERDEGCEKFEEVDADE